MSSLTLEARGRALEEAFFHKQEEERVRRIRAERAHRNQIEELARACGVRDEAVLAALLDIGIQAATWPALALVPLVAVAWADGSVKPTERAAVLEAARRGGLEKQSDAHHMLERWLEVKPPQALFQAWLDFARVLRDKLDAEQRGALRRDVLERARGVSKAAGGVLGLGPRTSTAEQEILDRISEAL